MHVLLGLARENDGVAMRILLDFGVDAERIRNAVLGMLAAADAGETEERIAPVPGRGPRLRPGLAPVVEVKLPGPLHGAIACGRGRIPARPLAGWLIWR